MKLQLGRWGNSLALRIPKYAVEALDFKANDAIEPSAVAHSPSKLKA